jgi:DNA-binding GntR family transcriptional regulator
MAAARSKPTGDIAPVEKNTHLAARAIQFIEDEIRAGRYLPGQRLVEAAVAADSGLSIAPVRDALRYLAGEGVIDHVPYRGATIKRLQPGELIHILQTLSGIGAVGISLAVRKGVTKADAQILRAALRDLKETIDKGSLAAVFNVAEMYHLRLHEIGGNPYLNICVKRLHLNLVHRELAQVSKFPNWVEYYRGVYAGINAAVEAGDEKRALDLFGKHMDKLIGSVES